MVVLAEIIADSSLYMRLRHALEKSERLHRGLDDQADLTINVTKRLREEANLRADKVRCDAAATILYAMRIGVGADERVARCLIASLKPSANTKTDFHDELPFVRNLPPRVAMYVAVCLRKFLAPKDKSDFQVVDDAPREMARLNKTKTPVSRLRIELSADEKVAAVENFMHALLLLNLTLPPDPNSRNVPTNLDEPITLGLHHPSTGILPAEVERVFKLNDECARWNAALALYHLGVDVCKQMTSEFVTLATQWDKEGLQQRATVADDLVRRAVTVNY